jgi:hypothetical protein
MSRGLYLFNDILETSTPEKQSKGRDKRLIDKRNQCLIDRLFFYKKNYHWDYDYILSKLSDEFFLSVVTIPKILELPDSQLYLRTLKLEQPGKDKFAQKWPHMKWAA